MSIADWQSRAALLHDITVVVWGINAVNWLFLGGAMSQLGIYPRTETGLVGILFSPLIHGSLMHLIGNTMGFFVFGWMILLRGATDFWLVTLVTVLSAGVGTWLFGRKAYHIGASGVVFGYFGFLLMGSFFQQDLLSLVLSLTVGTFYWNLLPGILPRSPRVSWEAHLFGFIGGILAAGYLPLIKANLAGL